MEAKESIFLVKQLIDAVRAEDGKTILDAAEKITDKLVLVSELQDDVESKYQTIQQLLSIIEGIADVHRPAKIIVGQWIDNKLRPLHKSETRRYNNKKRSEYYGWYEKVFVLYRLDDDPEVKIAYGRYYHYYREFYDLVNPTLKFTLDGGLSYAEDMRESKRAGRQITKSFEILYYMVIPEPKGLKLALKEDEKRWKRQTL